MPYIKQEQRDEIHKQHYMFPRNAGELNFVISRLIDWYVPINKNYDKINEVIGVLECAKLELYRRIAAPYEDRKCQENGDVYSIG